MAGCHPVVHTRQRGILSRDLCGAGFSWGQGPGNGQGISVMEQSVPIPTAIHLSWTQSEPHWREGTIIKCLQGKGYLKSIEVDIQRAHGGHHCPPSMSLCPCLGKNWAKYILVWFCMTPVFICFPREQRQSLKHLGRKSKEEGNCFEGGVRRWKEGWENSRYCVSYFLEAGY